MCLENEDAFQGLVLECAHQSLELIHVLVQKYTDPQNTQLPVTALGRASDG